ncbi:hypothetical protein IFM89_022337 [Coptis chinensis]|uniref:Protein kinase domain-containing protein n=1 Tax=Coptis chinensis TaxID=261450 RepID=A0A835I357_9MAGN|nr:hypothetical protein IFM89_022337 [Coptis chinensis]
MAQLQKFTVPILSFLYLTTISLFLSSTQSQQLLPSRPTSNDPSYYYNLCAPSTCNNFSLPYPFALPTPCHDPSTLQPLCPTNLTFLLTSALSSDTFRVLYINYIDSNTTTFLVASDSLFTCGAHISRPVYTSDASILTLSSNYTPGTHLNCTGPIPLNGLQGLQNASCLGCNGQDGSNLCYYAPWLVTYPNCETYHMYTLGGPFNASSVRDLRAYLQSGFQLMYGKPQNCRGCEASGDSLFTCGEQVSRPNYLSDASVFSLPFNYTPGTHFNCTGPIPSTNTIQGLQNASCIGCNGQDPSHICYYAPGFVTYPTCETYHMFSRGSSFNASSVSDMRAYLRAGFQLRYVKPLECRGCEISGGRCGSQPTSGSFVCFCLSSVHRLNCSDGITEDISTWVKGPGKGGNGLSRAVIAAISASASVLSLVILVVLLVLFVRRRKQSSLFNKETISSISPTRYSYSQLKKFTNNFSSKLGEGGFGSVYKGTILQSGTEVPVAVKILKKSKQIEKQFMNEVATIGSVHHHNLVSMLGYCFDGATHAVVYEFMENGSLDRYIYKTKKENDGAENESITDYKQLSSKQVFNIALETARGILYLHQGCRSRILHCDIKPPNVLLDSNFSAKVADFGLARMIEKDQSHLSLTGAQGTPGYAAPEMWLKTFGPVTEKSDVYSYGMLLLEMVGRRKNYDPEAADPSQVYFPEWLYNKIERDEFPLLVRKGEDNVSSDVVGGEKSAAEEDDKAVQRMSLVGFWCIQHIPSNRPSMDRVIQMLEGHIEIGISPHPFPQTTLGSHESTSQDALV